MTLIVGIFTRDNHNKKEIIFASDGLAVTYENNKKIGQDDDVEKIRRLTPKICMGYAGKNSELFEEVYNELKYKTPKKIKKELEPFSNKLNEVILKLLKTKKYSEIEDELANSNQLYHKFIIGGVFHGKLMLIRASPVDNYNINIKEVAPAPALFELNVVGPTEEVQEKTMALLNKGMGQIGSNDEIVGIIKNTISKIAERYPEGINNHIFIRRLSRNFDLERYKGIEES